MKRTYIIEIQETRNAYYTITAKNKKDALERIDEAEFSHNYDECSLNLKTARVCSNKEAKEILS